MNDKRKEQIEEGIYAVLCCVIALVITTLIFINI